MTGATRDLLTLAALVVLITLLSWIAKKARTYTKRRWLMER